ncbi:tRNA (N6-threonylcarbamoyladenosine(37)-N6)-methyltransferase TrmO [Halococcoides cellulosivorans]|uniref:tRNA (N6-threonylcarbamoyladenosine(37)-N6)-methyltransferase TrmO n=1 Tax=Halococcoides cellulosivorans TaxID=1679096 RepID=A0A2R4WXM6_9EURY|nr:tRNA (N6-threonylcarbamoyladenosine(37)-N6)-methyltransferase TrmO [Halococcoides cellulosivorans]AWB26293.1 tRNA (N6-threonylcarbamoyladenosine(37)-N6)-methyltransferase TrmO [Halococcoides cellulosivorans]
MFEAITQIGTVHSAFDEPSDPETMRERESTIVIDEAYSDGLYRIEDSDHLVVVFYIHEADAPTLRGPRRYGVERGTFASRSPHRPSPIGTTTVELLERDGRELLVRGLDAIDGTPVLDLKPYAPSLDRPTRETDRRADPRGHVERAIADRDREAVLLEAGGIHGHYCPYLALGVMAGVHAMRELGATSDGFEDLIAVTETNSCFADGVQVATGCTVGNNALVYRDLGKTAMTLVRRSAPDAGVRVHVKEREAIVERDYPEANALFERVIADGEGTDADRERLAERWAEVAFDLLDRPIGELCDIQTGVAVDLPDPAPIYEDAICAACGESVMAPKTVERDAERFCRACAGAEYHQLDGRGCSWIESDRVGSS